MKTTRAIAGVLLAVVAIIAIGSTAHNFRRLQSAQAATKAEARRHDAVRRQRDELQSDLARATGQIEALRGEASGVTLAKVESMKAADARPESARAKIDNATVSAQSPSTTAAQ